MQTLFSPRSQLYIINLKGNISALLRGKLLFMRKENFPLTPFKKSKLNLNWLANSVFRGGVWGGVPFRGKRNPSP